jgi:transposase-like protein
LKNNSSPFKWRHFEPAIVLLCVRWYCRYQLSYRDLEEMMSERGLLFDHTTAWRWVQRYAPEINKRIRPHLKLAGASYRVDETYIKVGNQCKYLYRAVDKEGNTIEFMLSAKRDVSAAKRFFKKMMRADHRRLPFSISVDKNAAYPEAFTSSQAERILPKDCKLRRVKYLNNVIEQDHRFGKRRCELRNPLIVSIQRNEHSKGLKL